MAADESTVAAIEAALYPDSTPEGASESQETAPEDQHLSAEEEADVEDEQSTQDDDAESEDDGVEDGDSDAQSLADYLGIPDDQLVVQDDGSVLIATKVDGEIVNVKPQDLIKNHQLEAHIQRQSQEVAEQKRRFQAETLEKENQFAKQLAEGSALVETAEAQLLSEYNAVPWDDLFRDDPGRYAAYKQAYAEKAQEITRTKAGVESKQKELWQAEHARRQEAQGAWMREKVTEVLAAFPEWQDNAKRDKDMNDLQEFAQSERYGIRDESLSALVDPGIIRLLQDAKAYRDGLANLETAKTTKKTPRFQKPGRKPMPDSVKRKLKNDRAFAKSGSVNDMANAILDQM